MPQFQLDTSGEVAKPGAAAPAPNDKSGLCSQCGRDNRGYEGEPCSDDCPSRSVAWEDLDAFTQGYIEALFFTEEESLRFPDTGEGLGGRMNGGDIGFSDLAPCALASIIADCEAFQRDNATTLAEAYTRDYDAEQAGRDFWFTRNGHGVGFWDRESLEAESLGERLSAACRYSEVSPYLGDDGKVYLS